MFKTEECVSSMVQRSSDAVLEDAGIKLRKVECASSMGQRSSCAAMKGAQINPDD